MVIAYILFAFVVGSASGAYALFRFNARTKKRHRLPKEWPLTVRSLINSKERRAWIWLSKIMFDQQVILKLPITRFTTPTAKEGSEQWYEDISGVYCTFTVCTIDGQVLGCIDVEDAKGPSLSNQRLKQSILSHCQIPYWVVNPSKLPHLTEIRTAFLGDMAVRNGERDFLEEKFKDRRQSAARGIPVAQDRRFARQEHQISSEFGESLPTSGWEQNSLPSLSNPPKEQ